MAKLISEKPANKYYSARKEWMVSDRFIVTVYYDVNEYSIFIYDKTNKLRSLDLTTKMFNELGLIDESDVSIFPSIDTCSIVLPKHKFENIFKLIESYLVLLEKTNRE